MVTKKIRTEYMKKFKDPKWETFSKCYEDLLNYRLSRRMLEQSHNPILWGGCETGSESSGRSTPQKNKICPVTEEETRPCERQKQEVEPKDASEPTGPAVEREPEEDTYPHTDRQDAEIGQQNGDTGAEGKHREGSGSPGDPAQRSSRKPKSLRAKSQPPQTTAAAAEDRHPFAMYGWAEQHANMAGKKTHNVLPTGSTTEIHDSALRAKTRRQVEKQMKNLQRQRGRSAEPRKTRRTEEVQDYNPWITEYMRCFSSRAR
ncbi:hypothetical protein COCON_G00223820 [Conger conger]|uniref:Centriole, cilia and spindle-associated protein n=1 Tax=Conger conger TaxID=82655 RepID=A0A9Q1CVR0_CONCO|nr:centriole, cilia and spindle-associated protein [Conger conger]XP_061083559.1 centriole, cilia and spindle-associated protein [Conger conger]KAJ8250460.1 hypothetical protein COCON_G00223820 [Conger conger]